MKKIKKQYPKEVLAVIPKGYYCHGEIKVINNKSDWNNTYICPFWFKIKTRLKQENGYCALLGKGDYELNNEVKWQEIKSINKNNKSKKINKSKTAHEIGLPMSLLWDQCKECGIKET